MMSREHRIITSPSLASQEEDEDPLDELLEEREGHLICEPRRPQIELDIARNRKHLGD